MSNIKWVEDKIPKHLSKHVQAIMRKHLLKEYYEMREKQSSLLKETDHA